MSQLIQDVFIIENLQVLTEGKNNDTMKVKGVFGRCNEKNNNGRVYPTKVLESQLVKVQPMIDERRLCGELDHPQNDTVKLSNASHLITKLEMKGDELIGEAEILKTPAGLTAKALIEGGVKIGISSRGMGTLSEDSNGNKVVNEDFRLVTFDLVADPSTRGAFPGLSESTESQFARASQSKLEKEHNFVTMLQSKLRESYDPWIEEARKKKSFPDLNRDGKITKADVLVGRGVIPGNKGKCKCSDGTNTCPKCRKEMKMEAVKEEGSWHQIADVLADGLGLVNIDESYYGDSDSGSDSDSDSGTAMKVAQAQTRAAKAQTKAARERRKTIQRGREAKGEGIRGAIKNRVGKRIQQGGELSQARRQTGIDLTKVKGQSKVEREKSRQDKKTGILSVRNQQAVERERDKQTTKTERKRDAQAGKTQRKRDAQAGKTARAKSRQDRRTGVASVRDQDRVESETNKRSDKRDLASAKNQTKIDRERSRESERQQDRQDRRERDKGREQDRREASKGRKGLRAAFYRGAGRLIARGLSRTGDAAMRGGEQVTSDLYKGGKKIAQDSYEGGKKYVKDVDSGKRSVPGKGLLGKAGRAIKSGTEFVGKQFQDSQKRQEARGRSERRAKQKKRELRNRLANFSSKNSNDVASSEKPKDTPKPKKKDPVNPDLRDRAASLRDTGNAPKTNPHIAGPKGKLVGHTEYQQIGSLMAESLGLFEGRLPRTRDTFRQGPTAHRAAMAARKKESEREASVEAKPENKTAEGRRRAREYGSRKDVVAGRAAARAAGRYKPAPTRDHTEYERIGYFMAEALGFIGEDQAETDTREARRGAAGRETARRRTKHRERTGREPKSDSRLDKDGMPQPGKRTTKKYRDPSEPARR